MRTLESDGILDSFVGCRDGDEQKLVEVHRPAPAVGEKAELIAAWLEDARQLQGLEHPAIPTVVAVGDTDTPFVASEFLAGQTLTKVLSAAASESLDLVRLDLVRLVADLADALTLTHEAKRAKKPAPLFHGRISPTSITVLYNGQVKLRGFGTTRLRDGTSTTLEQVRAGTASFLAPEQLNEQGATARGDLFSLGLVLWHCLTGKPVHDGKSGVELVTRVRAARLHPPSRVQADVPTTLDTICARSLRRDPRFRYRTARDMHKDLERVLDTAKYDREAAALAVHMSTLFADVVLEHHTWLRDMEHGGGSETSPPVAASAGAKSARKSTLASLQRTPPPKNNPLGASPGRTVRRAPGRKSNPSLRLPAESDTKPTRPNPLAKGAIPPSRPPAIPAKPTPSARGALPISAKSESSSALGLPLQSPSSASPASMPKTSASGPGKRRHSTIQSLAEFSAQIRPSPSGGDAGQSSDQGDYGELDATKVAEPLLPQSSKGVPGPAKRLPEPAKPVSRPKDGVATKDEAPAGTDRPAKGDGVADTDDRDAPSASTDVREENVSPDEALDLRIDEDVEPGVAGDVEDDSRSADAALPSGELESEPEDSSDADPASQPEVVETADAPMPVASLQPSSEAEPEHAPLAPSLVSGPTTAATVEGSQTSVPALEAMPTMMAPLSTDPPERRRWWLIAVPAALLVMIVLFFALSGGSGEPMASAPDEGDDGRESSEGRTAIATDVETRIESSDAGVAVSDAAIPDAVSPATETPDAAVPPDANIEVANNDPPPQKRKQPRKKRRPKKKYDRAKSKELYNQGLRHFFGGRNSQAEKAFRAAIKADPNYSLPNRGMGLVSERKGRKKQAVKWLRKYLRLAPKAGDAKSIRARISRLGGS